MNNNKKKDNTLLKRLNITRAMKYRATISAMNFIKVKLKNGSEKYFKISELKEKIKNKEIKLKVDLTKLNIKNKDNYNSKFLKKLKELEEKAKQQRLQQEAYKRVHEAKQLKDFEENALIQQEVSNIFRQQRLENDYNDTAKKFKEQKNKKLEEIMYKQTQKAKQDIHNVANETMKIMKMNYIPDNHIALKHRKDVLQPIMQNKNINNKNNDKSFASLNTIVSQETDVSF